MEFENILSDHNCKCLNKAYEDNTSTFAIKTQKNFLRVQDFYSYWEKGKRPEDINVCDELCSYKGVSVSIFNDTTKEDVIDIYKELFPLAPKNKPFVSIIKFYESSGLVKSTPNERNINHFDFYKSDEFDFTKISLIQVNELH